MAIKKKLPLFFLIFLFSCNYFNYYHIKEDEYIVNKTVDSVEYNVAQIDVIDKRFYKIFDSLIECSSIFKETKRKVPMNIVVTENKNGIIILNYEHKCLSKIRTCWGGFYYKGVFICILKPLILNKDIFTITKCNIRVNDIITCQNNWGLPTSVVYSERQKGDFIIKYKTCNYYIDLENNLKRSRILSGD